MAEKSSPKSRTEAQVTERLRELKQAPASSAIQGYIELLSDKTVRDRFRWSLVRIAKALGELGDYQAVDPLMNLYGWMAGDPKKRDKGCQVRTALVEAFGKIGDKRALPMAREAIKTIQIEVVSFGPEDTALELRATAALVISELESEPTAALHDLGILLFDMVPNLPVDPMEEAFNKSICRRAAAKAIARIGEPAGATLLAAKLANSQGEISEVLADCIEAFASLKPRYLHEILGPYIEGKDAYLSGNAAAALAQGLGEEAIPLLVNSYGEAPFDAKVAVVYAISSIRSGKTGEALMGFLKDESETVRLAAVEGLSLNPSPEINGILAKVADEDESDAVRLAARRCLKG